MLDNLKSTIEKLKGDGKLENFNMLVDYKDKIDLDAPDGKLQTDAMMHSIFGPAETEMDLKQQRMQFFADSLYGSVAKEDVIDEISLRVINKPYVSNCSQHNLLGNITFKQSIGYGLPVLRVSLFSDVGDSRQQIFMEDNTTELIEEISKEKELLNETRSQLEDIVDFYDKIEQQNNELIKQIAINDYDIFSIKHNIGFTLNCDCGIYTFSLHKFGFNLITIADSVRLAVEYAIVKLDLYRDSIDTAIEILKNL